MKVKVLGCSGGIGGALRTTGFLVDDDILIDAGTGVSDLSIEALLRIDHIFITHSHLDHIVSIPLMIDTVFGLRQRPLTLYATVETQRILREHIFNWEIWPDFNAIPNPQNPLMVWHEVRLGEAITLNGRAFTPVPANHVVPAIGYHIQGSAASMVFSGDTTSCPKLWEYMNRVDDLKYLIIECAFSNTDIELAHISGHFCPSLLRQGLSSLTLDELPRIYITHLKPGDDNTIMQEIEADIHEYNARPLAPGHVFEL